MGNMVPEHEGVHRLGGQDGDQRPAEVRHPHAQRLRLRVAQMLQPRDVPPRFDD
jgi:hypothetical protein